MYYLSLTLVNRGSKFAVVNWKEQGAPVSVEVGPLSQKMRESAFTSLVPPSLIQISAFEKDTNNSITINSQNSISVQFKESKEIVTIFIDEGIFYCFNQFSFAYKY